MTGDLLNDEIIFLTHDTFFRSSETANPPSPPLSHPLHGFSVWFLCGFYHCSRYATIKKINVIPSLQSILFSYSWTVMWWYEIAKCSAQTLSPQTCKVVLIFVSVPCMSFNLCIFTHVIWDLLFFLPFFFELIFLSPFLFPPSSICRWNGHCLMFRQGAFRVDKPSRMLGLHLQHILL